jgi:maleylpyruvate isomerase
MRLFSYWRSSAAYRVRIALNLKGIEYETVALHLLQGEHKRDDYLALNPLGLVPALELDDGRVLTQSTAIIQWLNDSYPTPPFLPEDSFESARIMSWVHTVACDIHPLNNVGVMNFLKEPLGVDPEQVRTTWYHKWLRRGFDSLETQLTDGPYCYGDSLTMADIYLVPQVYNAHRFKLDFSNFPRIQSICDQCNKLDAFKAAQPENQPDAE